MMRQIGFVAVAAAVSVGGAAFAADDAELAKLVAEDLSRPVRPGGVDGQAFWNGNALWFVYPPAFDFPAVEGAEGYNFRVVDSTGKAYEFTDRNPKASLAKVWDKVADGGCTLWWDATFWSGRTLRQSSRSFWKMAPYRPGSYPKAPRGYAEAVKLGFDYILGMKAMRVLVETGKPDPEYKLNCYPAKMEAAVIGGMLAYAKIDPSKREKALGIARAAADFLISISQPAGAPLAHFPPTYMGKEYTAGEYAGMNMLMYPVAAAQSYLALYDVTQEKRYRDAALGIAATYLRLQGEDGTWYLKLYEKDGRPVDPNRLQTLAVAGLFESVFKLTGDAAYRAAADRSFAYIENGPLKDWNWEGQFEDVRPSGKYVNLTKHRACDTAIHLVRRWPKDKARLAQARELLRFAEDQFVLWEVPDAEAWRRFYGTGAFCNKYRVPAVVEQYHYRELVDASVSKLIRTYLALYKATGNPLDLAKARTLGDSIVRMQKENGRIQTIWDRGYGENLSSDWVNCMISSLRALQELDETKD